MKEIEIYLNDLVESKRQEIINILGEASNYDVFPLATIPIGEDSDDEFDEIINKLEKLDNQIPDIDDHHFF